VNAPPDPTRRKTPTYEISSSYSFTKAAIAIIQTVYGSVSLYRVRGDQVNRFGYAAFGLTVIPYILMSIINLFGQIATPDYNTLYMVHSEEMDEARRRGGVFDGVIGTIPLEDAPDVNEADLAVGQASGPWQVISSEVRDDRNEYRLRNLSWGLSHNTAPEILKLRKATGYIGRSYAVYIPSCSRFGRKKAKDTNRDTWHNWREADYLARRGETSWTLLFLGPLICGAISIAMIGALTKFNKGSESTSVQRGFVMSWLIVGMLFGALSRYFTNYLLRVEQKWYSYLWRFTAFLFLFGVFIVPALGGFVMVGKMIIEFGTCTRLD